MTTLIELVQGLKTQVTNFTQGFAPLLQTLNDAAADALAKGNAAQAKAADFYSVTDGQQLYLDPVNGSDDNDGKTLAAPYLTWEKCMLNMERGKRVVLNILDDLDVDTYVQLNVGPKVLVIRSLNRDTGATDNHKLRFIDAADGSNNVGGFRSYAAFDIVSSNTDLELAHTKNRNPIYYSGGYSHITLAAMTISRTGTSNQALIRDGGAGHFEVSNVVIDPSASGFIITGVPSGGDPNARVGITSNFTTN